jgi:hypothetical protein
LKRIVNGDINMFAAQSESSGWGMLLPGLKTGVSATPTPRSDMMLKLTKILEAEIPRSEFMTKLEMEVIKEGRKIKEQKKMFDDRMSF